MGKIMNYSMYGVRRDGIDELVQYVNHRALGLEPPSRVFSYKNSCEDEDGKYMKEPLYSDFPILIEVYDVTDWRSVDTYLMQHPRILATLLERWSKEGGQEI